MEHGKLKMTTKEEYENEKKKLERELDGFQSGIDYKAKQQVIDTVERMRRIIGAIEVECPYCKRIQKTESYESRKCLFCRRTFEIFPKNDISRIADTERNKKIRPAIQELASLIKRKRFVGGM
jgi:hypothetical protein